MRPAGFASIAMSNCTPVCQKIRQFLLSCLLTKTLALLRVSVSEESRASPTEVSVAITYIFFPADAAVVNLRRKEAIVKLKFRQQASDESEEEKNV